MIRRFTNVALVMLTALSLVVSPVFAQAQEGQNPSSQGTPSQQEQQGQPNQPEPAQSQQTPGQAQPGQTQEPTGGQLKAQPETPAAGRSAKHEVGARPGLFKGKVLVSEHNRALHDCQNSAADVDQFSAPGSVDPEWQVDAELGGRYLSGA